MNTNQMDVHIRDVNGIADLEVGFGPPGVYVARGPNGVGKTSLIHAVRAATGDKSATAEPTDGMSQGMVEMGGVKLIVGRQRRMNGQPSVQLADSASLGKLIDPQIINPKAANRARIDALLRLVPLPADEEALRELTNNDLEFAATIRGHYPDALALADQVKRAANEEARRYEVMEERARGEMIAHKKAIEELGEVDASAPSVDQAKSAFESAVRAHAIAEAEAKAREQLVGQQQEIRASLGSRPELEALGAECEALRKEVSDIEVSLFGARARLMGAQQSFSRGKSLAEAWDKQSSILSREPVGADWNAAFSAEQDKHRANERLMAARALETREKAIDDMGQAKLAADSSGEAATRYRKLAASTQYALGRLLERAGIPGLSIDLEGMLVVVDAGGDARSFADRLSFGQKVALALEIALHAHRHRGTGLPCLLQLEPEFWLALDGERQKEVAQAARDKGVWLLTEAPDSGSLRVEEMR